MLKLRLDAKPLRDSKQLLEVKLLALICYVKDPVGIELLHAVKNRSQVRRCVVKTSITLPDDSRQKLLLLQLHDQRTLALCREFLLQQ